VTIEEFYLAFGEAHENTHSGNCHTAMSNQATMNCHTAMSNQATMTRLPVLQLIE